MTTNIKIQTKCAHCGQNSLDSNYAYSYNGKELIFCCLGCLSVFQILNNSGLSSYYDYKNKGLKGTPKPAFISNKKYDYYDDTSFIKDFSYNDNNKGEVKFFVEGVHCLACVWLLDKLPEYCDDVKESDFNWSESSLIISLNIKGKFSKVALLLNSFGYQIYPIKSDAELENHKRKENRSEIVRLGIAGACAGNIMIYSVSIYAGVAGKLAYAFGLLSLLLAIPTILYSAMPFYKNSFYDLKNKKISIDVPIVLAIFLTCLHGIWNIANNTQDHYFDTIGILIFLLLLSRYTLKHLQKFGLNVDGLNSYFNAEEVLVNRNGKFESFPLKKVKSGMEIKIMAGSTIPCDGVVLKGDTYINSSVLTGESRAIHTYDGMNVYNGTENLESDIIVEVSTTYKDTRLGKILQEAKVKNSKQSLISLQIDRLSEKFTYVILVIASLVFGITSVMYGIEVGLWRALSLIIITCPCALALSTPLSISLALSLAKKVGINIKDETVFEKLATSKNVFLDKTGTLTHGNVKVHKFINLSNLSDIEIKSIFFALENRSKHHIAKAIVDYCKDSNKNLIITKYNEVIGKGVEGIIDNKFYSIFSTELSDSVLTEVALYSDDILIAKISLKDSLRKESRDVVTYLQSNNLKTFLLSGDNPGVVDSVAKEVGINKSNAFSTISPEKKNTFIKKFSNSVMVGDGANDALALRNALVGVAMHGAADVGLSSADVYLGNSKNGIRSLVHLFKISKITMCTIKRNLTLSLIYNVLGVLLASFGLATPLTAAIIMPISSLTVLFLTIFSFYNFNRKEKLWKF
jgi:Cu2+-exporting ATPase/Cu+-exporting ATPase